MIQDLISADHPQQFLHFLCLASLGLFFLGSIDNSASFIEVLQLKLFLKVLESLLPFYLLEDLFLNTDWISFLVYDLTFLLEGKLTDVLLYLFLVVCFSELVDIGSEELLLEDFVERGKEFDELHTVYFVGIEPQLDTIHEYLFVILCIFLDKYVEVQREKHVGNLFIDEVEEIFCLLIRPAYSIDVCL